MSHVDWERYTNRHFYDELIAAPGKPRRSAAELCTMLAQFSAAELAERKTAADIAIRTMGITFTVYSEGAMIDRAWPFDIVPRIISAREWRKTEAGLKQRVQALNLFIDDLYHDQKVVKDKVLPAEVLAQSSNFRPQCVGVNPPHGVWAHICGSDLVRDGDGTLYVLEDNLRIPSGVSYMLENRNVTKRVLPELFASGKILPVDDYVAQLYDMLVAMSPRPGDDPQVVVLTPGIYNSAYFEHAYLAQQMGVELVQGSDLVVGDDDIVYMRTISGLRRVDVIYRRVDDAFLDPEVFNPESVLGCAGLMRAWRAGKVALANAPGAGVADDKVVYAFVPELIRYYLDQEPLLPNVPSYLCMFEKDRRYVLEHLDELVVKPANESGGYGMLIGPRSTKETRDEFARLITENPRNYMAQPTLALSTTPTLANDLPQPRHVDLRPFILSGPEIHVTTGGLTRVALVEGSLVVNSSQGGGSKDTWIVETDETVTADDQGV
ncbi:circularly permuted type 2 ATP-grasp protein [Halomonas dongshanensis]|uniref:Circularly permuted type 2 ATP-grasp protein n=1 Tax=Halomonas dongshanensis TaxID=2890835 RepID=A0ABT2EB10_9GAMM|nr:circularly permuted type 2 ATP-grasp protein [Halomonas dongshanensis]MCS2608709.1 circularly permuted type 2 ATP-grasp protein [Halomonas dongshanensis]